MPSLRTRAEPVVTTWYQDREGREPKPPECVPSALTWPRCRERADGEHCVMDSTVAGGQWGCRETVHRTRKACRLFPTSSLGLCRDHPRGNT